MELLTIFFVYTFFSQQVELICVNSIGTPDEGLKSNERDTFREIEQRLTDLEDRKLYHCGI